MQGLESCFQLFLLLSTNGGGAGGWVTKVFLLFGAGIFLPDTIEGLIVSKIE